jgi:hypothetical protein
MSASLLHRFVHRPQSPQLVALFRIAFYFGLGLHFAPSLLAVESNYSAGVVRSTLWNQTLHGLVPVLPPLVLQLMAWATLAGIAGGLLGVWPRVSALLTYAGTYAFASFNHLPVQTLALANAWAVLPVLCVCDGAASAWSVSSWWASRRGATTARPRPDLLGNLVLFQVLLAFFFAGIEKATTGWLLRNEMLNLFYTPPGYILRDVAFQIPALRWPAVAMALGVMTIVVELLTPVGLLFPKTRWWSIIVWEVLFVGIVVLIEVPPLFFMMFGFGVLLALDEDDLHALRRRGQARSAVLPTVPVAGAGADET